MADNRFETVYKELGQGVTQILVDKMTGVNYLWHASSSGGGGLTVLLDKDGKPVITTIEK